MIFKNALKEGRGYSALSKNPLFERKRNKYEFLKVKGFDVTYDFTKSELLVVKPRGEIINIFNDTSRVRFEYTTEEAKQKWTKFYRKIFPGENKKINTYTKKDNTSTVKKEERGEPSDYFKNAYLEDALLKNSIMTYGEFMKELAKDTRVLFV